MGNGFGKGPGQFLQNCDRSVLKIAFEATT